MRKTIKVFIPILELLSNLDAKQRTLYLKSSKQNFVKFLSDLIYNLNSGVFEVSDEIIAKLKPYRKNIQKLSQKGLTLTERKKILSSPKFFTNVIAVLVPELIKLVRQDN